jgi:DNA adenine methylase
MERSNFNLLRIDEELSIVHLRSARIYIENKHFAELTPRFDKPTTFPYLDPPYFGCKDYYGDGIFEREDSQRLKDILENIKGKFILSISDHPYIRETFQEFGIPKEQTTYLAASKTNKKVTELLVSNF